MGKSCCQHMMRIKTDVFRPIWLSGSTFKINEGKMTESIHTFLNERKELWLKDRVKKLKMT